MESPGTEYRGARGRWICLLLTLLLIPIAGCGEKTVTVSGKVTFRGQTLPRGTVRFLAAENQVLAGDINEDGTYAVPKIPVGTVKVSVTVPAPQTAQQNGPEGTATPDKAPPTSVPVVITIPHIYANPESSGLTYTVMEESQQTYNIELN